jgi:MscS family membrane protein
MWYHPPDKWWDFMAFVERTNLELLRRFNDEGIEFAFPSQTLYLAGDAARPVQWQNPAN